MCVNAAVGGGGAGLRFIPRDAISEEALETSFLKRIAAAFKGEQAIASRQERSGSQAGDAAAGDSEKATAAAAAPTGPVNDPSLPYQTGVEAVARELNANVSFQGLAAKTTKSNNLFPAMIAIITNLDKISNSKTPVPAGVTVTFLQALKRMVGTNVGYRGWAKLPVGKDTDKMAFATKLVQCLTNCLRASDSGVVYWTLEILYALCGPRGTTPEDRSEEEESQNKAMVLTERIINLLMKLLDAGMLIYFFQVFFSFSFLFFSISFSFFTLIVFFSFSFSSFLLSLLPLFQTTTRTPPSHLSSPCVLSGSLNPFSALKEKQPDLKLQQIFS